MKIYKRLGFSENFRKISIFVKISKNLDFSQNFRKISILEKKLQ